MLTQSIEAVLKDVVPLSVHGQVIWDVYYAPSGAPDAVNVARIGPESVAEGLKPGDRIVVDSVFGVVSRIRRAQPPSTV